MTTDFISSKDSDGTRTMDTKNHDIEIMIGSETDHIIKELFESLLQKIQVILLMITFGEKWHYLAVKKLSALLRGITSKHDGKFLCLNCFHSYTAKNKLGEHYNVCKYHDYHYVEMPN